MANKTMKPLAVAVGAAFLASVSLSAVVSAAENPFASQSLTAGYNLADNAETGEKGKKEGKCGEGKCGEGKCGADKKSKGEGKCGEGKCGEGKCGADKKSKGEGKCGEGKCGEGKCGADKKSDAT